MSNSTRGTTPRRRVPTDDSASNISTASSRKSGASQSSSSLRRDVSRSTSSRELTTATSTSSAVSSVNNDTEDEKLSHFLKYLNNMQAEQEDDDDFTTASLSDRPTVIHAFDDPPSPSAISVTSSASNHPKTRKKSSPTVTSSIAHSTLSDEFSESGLSFTSSVNNQGGSSNSVFEALKLKMTKMKLQLKEKNHEIHSLRSKLDARAQSEKDLARKM